MVALPMDNSTLSGFVSIPTLKKYFVEINGSLQLAIALKISAGLTL